MFFPASTAYRAASSKSFETQRQAKGQLVDIAAVDLVEGRGFGARRVVAVETPVTISRDGLGHCRQYYSAYHQRQH